MDFGMDLEKLFHDSNTNPKSKVPSASSYHSNHMVVNHKQVKVNSKVLSEEELGNMKITDDKGKTNITAPTILIRLPRVPSIHYYLFV